MKGLSRRTLWVAVAVLALALGLAACGSSGSSSSSSSEGGSTSEEAPSGETTTTSSETSESGELENVETALEYVGGTAGAAESSKSPITIGFVNQEGGAPSYPEELIAAEAAVEYVNEQLGGIEGHPLELKSCAVASSEQEGQACGQQFVNDESVMSIAAGGLSLGNQALYTTTDGKVAVIKGNLSVLEDTTAKGAMDLDSGILGVGADIPLYIEQFLKPKTVALINTNDAQSEGAAAGFKEAMKAAGIKVTSASFATGTTNLVSTVAASGAANAEVVVPFIYTADCPSLVKAFEQLGVSSPVVSIGLCVDPTVKESLGDYPEWTYMFPNENPEMPEASPSVAAYLSAMQKYAGEDAVVGGYAGFAFSSIMTTARVMNEIGAEKVTRESVLSKIDGYEGPGFMEDTYKCGAEPKMPAVCTLAARFYTYGGNDTWKDATGGKWVQPTD